jgi:hypothetical protein
MVKRLLTFGALAGTVVLLAGCTIFGDGTFSVGPGPTQATPGTYVSTGGPDCNWQRTDNFSGLFSSVISSDFLSGPDVVTILPTDAGFNSQGCGLWTPLPASGPQLTSFNNGAYAVGINIAAGTYSAPGGSGCYWEEDSNFLWTGSSIIDNGFSSGPVTITLSPGTVAFKTQRCGTWTMMPAYNTYGNCYLNPEGNCYFAGQYCPSTLYGLTVEGGAGPIACEEVATDVWEWVNVGTPPGGSCYLSPSDACYLAGEPCPSNLYGETVEGGDGPIACEQVATDVWEWVNVGPTGGSCYLSPSDTCYLAGEACPSTLYGQTVEGGDGPITCIYIGSSTYEWEAVNPGGPIGQTCYPSPSDSCLPGQSCPGQDQGQTVQGGEGQVTCDYIGDGFWEWESS